MNRIKRGLSVLLAVLLVCSMLATAALADEVTVYEETNSYALNYNGAYDGCKWQYFSPYMPSWYYDGGFEYNNTIIFSLYNTCSLEVIPAYCTDIDTGLAGNSNFRRINLEDSTYAAAGAGLLRSVVLNSFPNVSVAELGEAAGVSGLTIGEAVAATQLAVWQSAHGGLMSVSDFVYGFDTQWSASGTTYYDDCMAEINSGYAASANEQLIESHIEAVFNYLTGLAPTAPAGKAVNNDAFISWSEAPELSVNEDGSCSLTITAVVEVYMTEADSMTLSAIAADGSFASAALVNGENNITLTIPNVSAAAANGNITLAIDGTQTLPRDVYLFDAEGERGSSQSLVGIDDSQLPVHAEISIETPRIINIYKTTKVAVGTDENGETIYERRPLEGITFDIYLAAELDAYLGGEIDLPETPSYSGQPDYTITTDENGNAALNLTQAGMPDGVYTIVEREQPAISAPVAPFYVIIPATNAEGTDWVYTINIEPKNDIAGEVEIDKDVISLGNNSASVDAYTDHTWIISTTIPADIADGKSYVITDTLDNRLDYVGNMTVQVELPAETVSDESAEEAGVTVGVVLEPGLDYTLTVEDNDSLADGKPSDSFAVALTAEGMSKIAEYAERGTLRICFDAQINANAAMGEEIPNRAEVNYINSVNFEFDVESDKPVVCTGGIELSKVDSKDSSILLSGAVFEVYRNATEAEVAAGEGLVNLEGYSAAMVRVSFFAAADLSGGRVSEARTDENGTAYIYGLAYGSYYLVETKAPAGYNLMGEAVEFTVGAESHTVPIIVENTGGVELPETGGVGTTVFYVVGGILVVAAVVLLVTRRRMKNGD